MTDRRTDHPTTIAILGGTGALGRGLAVRFARAGIRVRLGSRDADRAQTRAAAITERPGVPSGSVTGHVTDEAVGDAEVVVLCTPYDAQAATLDAVRDQLAGRVLVSCVNPLRFDADGPHPVAVPEGSAAQAAAARVPDARVVAAFHHVPAAAVDADGPLHDATVLVVGADPEARAVIVGLAATVASGGGVDAGPLRHAATLEAMTAVLIEVNRRHDAHAGLAVTGLPDRAG